MIDALLTKIIEKSPYGFWVLIVLIGGIILWKIFNFVKDTQGANKTITTFNNLLDTLKIEVEKMNKGFSGLCASLYEKKVVKQDYSVINSPRQLNELGKQLFTDSGAEELFIQEKEKWIKELENKNIDSAWETEKESFILLIEKMYNPEFKKIQNFAYINPKYQEKDLSYNDILFVISLELRNAYLNKHPELKPKEEEKK